MRRKKVKDLRLDGNNFYLRNLRFNDINKNYLSWLNDKKITQYLYNPKKKYLRKDLIKYFKEIDFNRKMIFAIIDKKNNKHVGNMGLSPIDVENQKTGLGGIIGDKKYWGSSAFVEGLKLLIDYAFEVRKFIKVESGVTENNVPCIIASEKDGLKFEGIRKKTLIIDNISYDTYLFGITNKKNENYHVRHKKNIL